jgi:Domain of unknown function (DUF4926)
MFNDLDTVALTRDIPEFSLTNGDVGTVVAVYANGKAYEVEFMTLQGRTIAVVTLQPGDLRLVGQKEIAHAREFA